MIEKGQKFPVLDDGFIQIVDWMGDDSSIVQAARVSYGTGTKSISDDRTLIRYLLRHQHTTPFEMCELKLLVRVPMDCWRQWIRHRSASVNEYSTRYSEAIDSMQKTKPGEWRLQAKDNKQGSAGFISEWPIGFILQDMYLIGENRTSPGSYLSSRETQLHKLSREIYKERLAFGVAREQARKDLPLSTYTEAYWKIDLHNLLHFLKLRMDSHAQWEIRQYADIIGHQIVRFWVPEVWTAFKDYQLNAINLTQLDQKVLAEINEGNIGTNHAAHSFGWLANKEDGSLKNIRERTEFESKADRIKLKCPWKN